MNGSITWLQLTIVAFMITSLAFTKEGFTSGGGQIDVTHDLVRVTLTTGRKTPMPEHAAAYEEKISQWEQANQPVAEKVAAAIERNVLRTYRTKLRLIPKRFASQDLVELSSEGITREGAPADAALLLSVPLDLFPGGDVRSTAMFVLEKRPGKAEVRAFSRDVQAAARRAIGKKPAAKLRYTAYWLVADAAQPTLLLTTVPVAKLQATLEETPWSPMGFETFRRAPALVIETQAKTFATRNSAGLLIANPTAAKMDTAAGTVVLQVNGSYLPAMKVQKATRAQALRLLRNPVDPSLDSTAAAEARKQAIDDIEFLGSLTSSLAN